MNVTSLELGLSLNKENKTITINASDIEYIIEQLRVLKKLRDHKVISSKKGIYNKIKFYLLDYCLIELSKEK